MSSLPRISNAARRPRSYSALRPRIRRRSARSAASSQPDWFGASTLDLVSTDRDSTWRSTRLSTMVSQSVAPSSSHTLGRIGLHADRDCDRRHIVWECWDPPHPFVVLRTEILEPAVAAAVCYILSVAYRSQLDQPAGYLQDCAQARSNRSRYLLDLRGLMAYNDAPALQYTSHRHHGFAVIQS